MNVDNFISIEYDSMFQGLLRFFYNNSREKNINNINNFYFSVFNQIDDLINSKYLNIKNDFRKSQIKNIHTEDDRSNFLIEHKCDLTNENFLKVYNELMEIQHYITLSINGLNNLKRTYNSDVLTSSKIDIIISNVEFNIKKINKKLEYIDSIKKIISNDEYVHENKKIK